VDEQCGLKGFSFIAHRMLKRLWITPSSTP
jgi:hypothetical protein